MAPGIPGPAFGLLRLAVFLAALGPLGRLVWLGMHDALTANPLEFVTRSTGTWALVFLCLSLSMTPLRRFTGMGQWKSIVRIRFTENEPKTSWHLAAPNEYGFYSNVNPTVNHPRWSQATEQRIGDGGGSVLFPPKRKTLMFNGYAGQVASLYTGMDLKKNF
jgi:hypothetical protein